jgi:hypothetical protein
MCPVRMDRIESGSRIVIELTEAINHQKLEKIKSLLSDDCVLESSKPAPDGQMFIGKENIKEYWKQYFLETPKIRKEIEEIMGFGIRCVLRWKLVNMDSIEK